MLWLSHTNAMGTLLLQQISAQMAFAQSSFFQGFIFLFLERGEERQRNIDVQEKHWSIVLYMPQPGTKIAMQTCGLTGNQTCDLSFCRTMPKQLSHTCQGLEAFLLHLKKKNSSAIMFYFAHISVCNYCTYSYVTQYMFPCLLSVFSVLKCRKQFCSIWYLTGTQ